MTNAPRNNSPSTGSCSCSWRERTRMIRMMLGSGAPVIRITVADTALETGVGLARIDGQPIPVSLDTVRRLLCTGIQRTITIDAFGTITEPDDHDTTTACSVRNKATTWPRNSGAAWTPPATGHPPGAKTTTSCTGNATKDPPDSTTESSSADTTTSNTTTTAPKSSATNTANTGKSPHPATTPHKPRSICR